MAVSAEYVAKIRRTVRRHGSTDVDEEVVELIEECRADLIRLGILSTKATDEDDALILGVMKIFVRSRFGLSNPDAEKDQENYKTKADELRKTASYTTEA